VTIGKTIATPLTVCVATGSLMVIGQPAQATTRPTSKANSPALACRYRVAHVRPGSHLNVRSGAGLRHRPIGKLRAANGRIAGSCRPTKRWLAVKTSNGKSGWAYAHYLHRAREPRVTSYPALACSYRVAHVRPGNHLNVRSGAGLRHRPIGRLRAADGRIAGSCRSTKRWVAVNASNGKSGWASARYLRR
jgi:uncharacterized protein YraI